MPVPGSAAASDPRPAEILAIFSREVGVAPERLRPEATLDSLEIASLDVVQAMFAIEERYDVQIPVVPDRAGSEFTTVGQLLDHVLVTLDRGGPPAAVPGGTAPGAATSAAPAATTPAAPVPGEAARPAPDAGTDTAA